MPNQACSSFRGFLFTAFEQSRSAVTLHCARQRMTALLVLEVGIASKKAKRFTGEAL